MTVGGLRNVYGGKAEVTLPTGYNMALEDMPPVGNVLPAGTPFGLRRFRKDGPAPLRICSKRGRRDYGYAGAGEERLRGHPCPASAWC